MDIKEIINKRYAMPDASLDKLQRCLTEVSYPYIIINHIYCQRRYSNSSNPYAMNKQKDY
jgi:hypothetical protein